MPLKISNDNLKKPPTNVVDNQSDVPTIEKDEPTKKPEDNKAPAQIATKSQPQTQDDTSKEKAKDTNEKTVSLFGGKLNLTPKAFKICRMAIPFAVVLICLIIVTVMINSRLSDSSKIEGRFEIVSVGSEEYIELKANNTFVMNDGEAEGTWSLDGEVITFEYSSGNSVSGRFIDGKYIMLVNERYFKGEIPSGTHFDTVLVYSEGNDESKQEITFSSDGKVINKAVATGEVIEGTYNVEGNFIIISLGDKRDSFLKCSDGMSNVYYQLS